MPLEIERKFLIAMPNLEWITQNHVCQVAHITQTYLGKNQDGFGSRVRMMEINRNGKVLSYGQKDAPWVYSH